MGKQGLAGICPFFRHLRVTPWGSVIAGDPRMGIRSPTGLQMCKLRLWFAREFATTRTERPGPSAPVMGTGSRISGQSKKRRGLTGWESSTMKPQRGKPSLVLRRRSFKGNRPAQSPRGGGGDVFVLACDFCISVNNSITLGFAGVDFANSKTVCPELSLRFESAPLSMR